MLLFRSPEDPLDGLLPPGIDLPIPAGMADVLHHFHILFPYMSGDCLDMALAVGASPKARAVGTVGPTTLILPIPRPVCCPVCQDMILRADVTVVVLVIYILILLKKPIFCHRSLVREQRQDAIREQLMRDRGCAVPRVHDDHLWGISLYLLI